MRRCRRARSIRSRHSKKTKSNSKYIMLQDFREAAAEVAVAAAAPAAAERRGGGGGKACKFGASNPLRSFHRTFEPFFTSLQNVETTPSHGHMSHAGGAVSLQQAFGLY